LGLDFRGSTAKGERCRGWNESRGIAFYANKQATGHHAMMTDNPKVDPPPLSHTEKDPDDWVSGDEPMTGAQASYLKTLTEQLGDPDQFKFKASLTKAEASKRIDSLKSKLERKRESRGRKD